MLSQYEEPHPLVNSYTRHMLQIPVFIIFLNIRNPWLVWWVLCLRNGASQFSLPLRLFKPPATLSLSHFPLPISCSGWRGDLDAQKVKFTEQFTENSNVIQKERVAVTILITEGTKKKLFTWTLTTVPFLTKARSANSFLTLQYSHIILGKTKGYGII